VEIRFELEGRPQQLARMTDYSADGFCIQSSSEIPPGKRLLVENEVEGELVRIPARTAWQFKSADGLTIGCVLEHPLDSQGLQRLASAASTVTQS